MGLYRIVPLLMYYQGPVYYNYHRAAICESYVLLSWFSVQISSGLCSFPIHVFRIITLLPSLLNQSARQVNCSSDALLDARQFDELWGQTTEPHLSHVNYKSRTDLRLSLSRVTSGVSIALSLFTNAICGVLTGGGASAVGQAGGTGKILFLPCFFHVRSQVYLGTKPEPVSPARSPLFRPGPSLARPEG